MQKNEFSNLNILYVEDEDFIRKNALEFLGRFCNKVYEAKDGIEAIELLKTIDVDVIITDIKMPKLNGLDMTKHIRQKNKKVQIIIATAFTQTSYLIEAVELGFVKYLIKPLTFDKIMPVLQKCVENLKENESSVKLFSKDVKYDIFNKSLVCNDEVKKLTKNEIRFLDLLCKNSQRTVTYSEIENYIWQDSVMSKDALKSLVRALRKKLPQNCISNISGLGYKINLYDY